MQGIKQLTKLISETCPGIIREQELKMLTGRKIAIDASMAIYQFLVWAQTPSVARCPWPLLPPLPPIRACVHGGCLVNPVAMPRWRFDQRGTVRAPL